MLIGVGRGCAEAEVLVQILCRSGPLTSGLKKHP